MEKAMQLTEQDITFRAMRASGPGGQHVDHRSTKVQVRVCIADLPVDSASKNRIREKLASRITNSDELIVENDERRSQRRNKEAALERLNELLNEALKQKPIRIPTTPPKAVRKRRLTDKRRQSTKKEHRTYSWNDAE